MGHSAADTVKRIPRDSKSLEIQVILMEYCGINFENSGNVAATSKEEAEHRYLTNVWERMPKLLSAGSKWVEQMRGNVSVVPAIVSTITFQAAVNPPGGVIQQGINSNDKNSTINFVDRFDYWLLNGPLGCRRYRDEEGNITAAICPGTAILSLYASR